MIKAVIFDMDGVIIDSEIVYMKNVQRFLRTHGVEVDLEELFYFAGGSAQVYAQNIAKFLNVSEEIAAAYYRQFNLDFPTDFASLLRPEAVDLLKYIKERGYKIGLASSGTMERIDRKLDECRIRSYFDAVVSGTMFKKTKPHPEIFLYTASQLDVKPEECLVIEDSTVGINGAHNANMMVVALYDARFKFDTANASVVVNNLSEVVEVLDGLVE